MEEKIPKATVRIFLLEIKFNYKEVEDIDIQCKKMMRGTMFISVMILQVNPTTCTGEVEHKKDFLTINQAFSFWVCTNHDIKAWNRRKAERTTISLIQKNIKTFFGTTLIITFSFGSLSIILSHRQSRNLRTLTQQFGPHLANIVVYVKSKSAIMHV